MRNLKNAIVLVCPLMILAVVSIHGLADEGGTDRPFRGYAVSTSSAFSLDNPAPDVFQPENPQNKPIIGYFDITYVGQATHMGNITRQEYVAVYADATFEGLMFWEAANGDELVAVFDGSLSSLSPPADGSGCYTFIGGTGRFENASGVTCFELFTPDLANVFVTFDGMISF